jgi:6-pyruvoyltetrahydropterin/6-carboxytetrahydropterin synthase
VANSERKSFKSSKLLLAQRFYFEAAHTLERQIDAEPSRRIHGHTYNAEVAVSGAADAKSGMVVDLAVMRQAIDVTRDKLDHRLLDEVEGLGAPTLENLCAFIAGDMHERFGGGLVSVKVWREASGDSCMLMVD